MFKVGLILTIIYSIIYNIVIANQGDYYGTYTTYNNLCFKRNIFAWLPPISVLLIGLGILFFSNKSNFNTFMSWLFLIIATAVAGIINSIHASHTNVDTGYQMDMTDTERFQKEKNNEKFGKAAAIGGALYSAHNIKKNVKEFTNVDSWKEFK